MRQESGSTLDQAVGALRETIGPETLSASSRAAILRRISEREPSRTLAVLFPTSWRVVLAGALPVALALTVVVLAGRDRGERAMASPEPVVHKVNGRVVIEVAAGATVTKSSVPFVFDDRRAVRVTDGRYQDRSAGDHSLVFYRIE